MLWTALSWITPCRAQDSPYFHPWTFDAAVGYTSVEGDNGIVPGTGSDTHILNNGLSFQAGAGRALMHRTQQTFDHGVKQPVRHWNFFLTGNFFYERSGINPAAVQEAILLNPQNPALLSATSAKANFYSTTIDPTFRYTVRWFDVYALGGGGWLRRSIAFNGANSEGSLLQPGGPSIFGVGGNSGGIEGGGGVDVGLPGTRGLKVFGEVRVIRGLGINSRTTLVPASVGFRW